MLHLEGAEKGQTGHENRALIEGEGGIGREVVQKAEEVWSAGACYLRSRWGRRSQMHLGGSGKWPPGGKAGSHRHLLLCHSSGRSNRADKHTAACREIQIELPFFSCSGA